jgi:organic radical activating enzyme
MTKEKSLENFLESKVALNKISPCFCAAKWTQTTLHLHNGSTHSCHHPYPHKISIDEIKKNPASLHNTFKKIEMRKQMLAGTRPAECSYCWRVEDSQPYLSNQVVSDRIIKSTESWSQSFLEEILSNPSSSTFVPGYLEVSFSSSCNMKCSYCSPVFSSRWREEVDRLGPYPTSQRFNDSAFMRQAEEINDYTDENNPYVAAFWRWWPELRKKISVLRITGGEPLLSEHTFKLFSELKNNPAPNLDFAVNSNSSLSSEIFDRFVHSSVELLKTGSVSSVKLFTSLDSYGEQAEYARFGLNFSLWQRNIEKYLSSFSSPQLTIMCTSNIFSLFQFENLFRYVLQLKHRYPGGRITIDTNILQYPHHLSLKIADSSLRNSLDSALKFLQENQVVESGQGFLPIELMRFQRVVGFLQSSNIDDPGFHLETARKDFVAFVDEHDRRRKTNFAETFPQLLGFYKSISDS